GLDGRVTDDARADARRDAGAGQDGVAPDAPGNDLPTTDGGDSDTPMNDDVGVGPDLQSSDTPPTADGGECQGYQDCPGRDGEFGLRTCLRGICGYDAQPRYTSCRYGLDPGYCDGAGFCAQCLDDTHCFSMPGTNCCNGKCEPPPNPC